MGSRTAAAAQPDADAGFPLYRQLQAVLLNQIANGELRVGDRLPTEEALAAQFGLSRVTVRLALDELERDGLIVRRRALGTFLKAVPRPGRADALRPRPPLARLVADLAVRPGRVLRQGAARPPAVVSRELGLAAAAEAPFVVRTLAGPDGAPVGLKRFFHPRLAPHLTDRLLAAADLERALGRAAGGPLRRAHGWVEAILAEPHMVMILAAPVGSALLSVWWVSTLRDAPVLVSQALLRATATAAAFDFQPRD